MLALETVADQRFPQLALAFELHARMAAHTYVVIGFVPVMTLRTLGVLRYVIVMRIWIEIRCPFRHRLERLVAGEALIGLDSLFWAFLVTALAIKAGSFMQVGCELLLALADSK